MTQFTFTFVEYLETDRKLKRMDETLTWLESSCSVLIELGRTFIGCICSCKMFSYSNITTKVLMCYRANKQLPLASK